MSTWNESTQSKKCHLLFKMIIFVICKVHMNSTTMFFKGLEIWHLGIRCWIILFHRYSNEPNFHYFFPPNVTVWMLSVIPAVFGKHIKCLSLKPTDKEWLATTEWHWHNKKETDPIFTTMDRLWLYLQFDDQSWKATVARLLTIWEIGKNICGLKKRNGKQETVLCLK